MTLPPLPEAPSASHDLTDRVAGGMALAGAMIAYGARRRGLGGMAVGIAGAGLLASIVAPRLTPRVRRVADAARPIDVEGSIIVERPVGEVFAFFRNFEHFPLLGGMLHSVEDFDDGRSRWRVLGRNGVLLEWDVIVTKYVPKRVIAWESTGRGPVESSGTARFHAVDDHATRVDVSVHYFPRTVEAARALRPLISRLERRVRAAIGRIEEAMHRAGQPGFYDRIPSHPLPDHSTPD
ncbi:MAG: SRPBCC family protein [Gemmatimonadaceae bacterium]|nr:SRPBCC family protein [Gemmatimonadaceae bacterium]